MNKWIFIYVHVWLFGWGGGGGAYKLTWGYGEKYHGVTLCLPISIIWMFFIRVMISSWCDTILPVCRGLDWVASGIIAATSWESCHFIRQNCIIHVTLIKCIASKELILSILWIDLWIDYLKCLKIKQYNQIHILFSRHTNNNLKIYKRLWGSAKVYCKTYLNIKLKATKWKIY